MNRSRLRRFVGIAAAAALMVAVIGVGAASAAQPLWDVTFDNLPNKVAPGNDAGFEVTVWNKDTSNINNLTATVTAETGAAPTYFSSVELSTGGTVTCTSTSSSLVCPIGTLVAGAYATFTVAFAVPLDQTGNFDIHVALRAGTGDTSSDKPGKSRGDAGSFPWFTEVSASSNFDGGFVVGDYDFSTNQEVGRRNPQATSLTSPANTIGVTIEDGITSGVTCDATLFPQCARLFGEWSALNVNDGATYPSPFKVVLLLYGQAVPAGLSTDDIVVVHVLDDGTVDVIGDTDDEICASATTPPTSGECIYVTKVGSNYQIVVYLLENGTLRGGF